MGLSTRELRNGWRLVFNLITRGGNAGKPAPANPVTHEARFLNGFVFIEPVPTMHTLREQPNRKKKKEKAVRWRLLSCGGAMAARGAT